MASEREEESEEGRRGPGFLDFRGLYHVAAYCCLATPRANPTVLGPIPSPCSRCTTVEGVGCVWSQGGPFGRVQSGLYLTRAMA